MRQLSQTFYRLNMATRPFHAAADEPWLSLVAPSRRTDRQDYIELLANQYGFDAPLEAALAYTRGVDLYLDVHRRFRAGLIAQDLLSLGVSPAEIARLPQCMVAPFSTVVEAFGWLYVHERSMSVQEAVVGELTHQYPDLAHAALFARSREGRVGIAWDDLGLVLDRVARTPDLEDCIVNGAIDGFRALTDWITRSSAGIRLTGSS